MTNSNTTVEIISEECSHCPLCNSTGTEIYHGLQDNLFGVPGYWNLKQCNNAKCHLAWLDPMPSKADIYKAYLNYYTHPNKVLPVQASAVKKSINRILDKIYSKLLLITGVTKHRKAHEVMYLNDIKPGKVLELGCGNGERLLKLQEMGWEVEGQEVDPQSASLRNNAITVHLGELKELALPDNSFDAIVMNHVIEHIHNPVDLLIECKRLLRQGGICVAVTPNISSLGHKVFKNYWLNLDPPRHLNIFTTQSLSLAARKAGFDHYSNWTSVVNSSVGAKGSFRLKKNESYGASTLAISVNFMAAIYQLFAYLINFAVKDSGDECVILMKK